MWMCVCGRGEIEESARGYFQLRPFSYLMVFIGAKGQRWCVYVRFLTPRGGSRRPAG